MGTNTKQVFATLEAYKALMSSRGLTWVEQSGFLKVEPVKGRRIYVANTKTVRRVDVSGWEASLSLAGTPKGGRFGQVTGQLRIEGDIETQLLMLDALIDELLAQPPVEPKVKAVKVEAAEIAKDLEAKPAKDLDLIARVAEEMGVPVSPLAMADGQ